MSILVFCLLFGISLSAASERHLSLSAAEQGYLKAHGPIIFVSQTSYPPFEELQGDGSMDGMCIELARWMSTELGVKVTFTNMSFQKAQEAVQSGTADVLTSLFYSDKRAAVYAFTEPLFDVPASIFVRPERPDISRLEDLKGKRIAIQHGDYARDFLESKGIIFTWVPVDSFAQATEAVIDGRAEALIGDEQIVLYHLFRNNLTEKVKKIGEPLYVGKNCMAVKKDNAVLYSIVARMVQHGKATGVLTSISHKWLGEEFPAPEKNPRWLIGIGIAGGASLLCALAFWVINARLRRILRENVREQNAVLEASVVGIAKVRNRTLLWANPAMCNMFGYTLSEIQHANTDLFYPSHELHEQLGSEAYPLLVSGQEYHTEMEMRRKDGSTILVKLQGTALDPADTEGASVWTFQDVTAWKQAQDDLLESKNLLERIFDSTEIMIAYLDSDFNFIRVNRAYAAADGLEREYFIGRNHFSLYPDADNESLFRQVVETGIPHSAYAKPFEFADHPERGVTYWNWTLQPVKDAAGVIIGLIFTLNDVTELQHHEAERTRTLALLQTVINTAPMRIFWKDLDLRYLGCNRLFAKDAGKSDPEELIGKDDYDMGWADQAELYRADDRMVMESGTARLNFEEPQTTPDGTAIWLRTSKVPLRDSRSGIIGILGVYEDITRMKEIEKERFAQLDELRRWQEVMLGREERVIQLKAEVNALLARQHELPRYISAAGEDEA